MEKTKQQWVEELTDQLNRYRHEYYNLNAPSVTDEVYDSLFDELALLEQETGICMANSPTQTAGYPADGTLEKTAHPIPLLSLDKTKSISELYEFINGKLILLMLQLDGLTIKLTYEGGKLIEAATRGDGEVGEIITHNTRGISGIPQEISHPSRVVITGEAFIHPSDFEALKVHLLDSTGKPYKNGSSLAASSVRLLDAAACRERRVCFQAFNVLEGFEQYPYKGQRLRCVEQLGFTLCKYLASQKPLKLEDVSVAVNHLRDFAATQDLPIDGIVLTYNDVAYAESCGRTGHHYKDSLALKFSDNLYKTTLCQIEWTPTHTGEIVPVAVFAPVEIDGVQMSRADLHNLSFIEGLELMPGNRVMVGRRNQNIPNVEENLDRGSFALNAVVPRQCPCCGKETRIHETKEQMENGEERTIKTLFCDNDACDTRRLRQFVHFASQEAMNMEGLSEATLEKFIGKGWLHSYRDLYRLDQHRAEITQMEGLDEKSWQNIWDAIQHSRMTTFDRYLISMDIPMIGSTASRALCQQFQGSLEKFETAVLSRFDFTQLPDIGPTMHANIYHWFRQEENWVLWSELRRFVHIMAYQPPAAGDSSKNTPFT